MDKYLYIEFINNWGKQISISMDIGTDFPIKRRIVKIKLTDEQIKQLEPKKIGRSKGNDIYEDMRILCIQEE